MSDQGMIFMGPGRFDPGIQRIDPAGEESLLPLSYENRRAVMWPKDDGSYYTGELLWKEGALEPGKDRESMGLRVQSYAPDGAVIKTWNLPQMRNFSPGNDGLIYTVDQPNRLAVGYSLDGKIQRKVDISKAWPEGSQNWEIQIQVDRNGDVYAVDWNKFYRFNSKGELLARWDAAKPYVGGGTLYVQRFAVRNGLIYAMIRLSTPQAIEGDKVTILDTELMEVRIFAPDGQFVARYIAPQPELNMPGSVAAQEDGSWAAILLGAQKHLVFDASGKKFFAEWMTGSVHAMTVAAKPGGGFYFAVGEVDNTGKAVRSLYTRDPDFPEGLVDNALQVAVDPVTKNLWGLGGGGSISCITPEGEYIKRFGMNRDLNFRTWAKGMCVDNDGYLYLPDPWRHRIVKVSCKDGSIVSQWGKEGTGLGEMRFPEGIAIDSQSRLYVADCENSRIQAFDTDGNPLGVWGKQGTGPDELDRPLSLCVGPNNTLWIADTFNDRIVKASLEKFWAEATKTPAAPVAVREAKISSAPDLGDVTVSGVVIAGSDDLTDTIYIESPDRVWGMRVTLPEGKSARRGEHIKVSGKLELKERGARHMSAKSIEKVASPAWTPAPLGMANLLVGDGFQNTDTHRSLSNQGLLVMTWGRVMSVESQKGYFIINDGSYPADSGVIVYAGQLRNPVTDWPEVGQYVGVVGVSVSVQGISNTPRAGVRIRKQDDIQVFAGQ